MCQRIIQFCSGSTKPLLMAGSLLSLLSAIAIGYIACNTNSLYQDLDPQVAQGNALSYYVQLSAAFYLILVTVLSCFVAQYDEKHSTRVLALVSALNFLLALVAILMMPSGKDIAPLFASRLEQARKIYDFKDKPRIKVQPNLMAGFEAAASFGQSTTTTTDQPKLILGNRTAREATPGSNPSTPPIVRELDPATATKIWDSLQERGCCGFNNATLEWGLERLPKSCCCEPVEKDGEYRCAKMDLDNEKPCIQVIGAKSFNLMITLALIALVNLYLATLSGMSVFKTLHYNEASQNAYS